MQEIWKDINGFVGKYQISNLGNVKNAKTGRILKQNKKRYSNVVLYIKSKPKYYRVHRLVAEAFIPNPNNYPYINHKDENKQNNNVENLEWCDAKYNSNYGKRNELVSKNQSKYKIIQKDLNNNIIKVWDNIWDLTHNTKYKKDSISCCCRGKFKTAYGYKWEYILINK